MKLLKSFKIRDKIISDKSPSYIIAEVGPNHNGSFEMASHYVDALSEIGVDAIKFQLVNPDLLFSENAIFAYTISKKP